MLFFVDFHLTLKNIFSKKTDMTLIFWFFVFSFFLFKIKHYPITRKKQNGKPFFCIFSKIKNIIFVLTKVKFFNNTIEFTNTKQGFFNFFHKKSRHTCIYFIINLQKKLWEQRCLFTCPNIRVISRKVWLYLKLAP